jgi:ketosteroid isomerase-like protein
MSIRNSSTLLSALLICLTAHAYGQNVLSSAGAQSLSPASSCGAASTTDSSALARVAADRKQIDAQYAKLADAISRKDLNAIIALYTPDFHAVTATGEVWTREQSLNYVRAGMSQVSQTRHIINTIVAFTACGDTATATVLQYWDRTQMKAGKLRHVDTHAVQDEQWVRTSEGWRRGNIFNVRNGPAFVDGKRVDTNKQYDPEAPEYDPYDPRPKQPAADTLLRIATEHGIGAALDAARILRHSDRYFVTESQLNTVGYGLLASKCLS